MPITADDLLPLVLKLSREERICLARLALASVTRDPSSVPGPCEVAPALPGDLGGEEGDPLAWEGEGWEDVP